MGLEGGGSGSGADGDPLEGQAEVAVGTERGGAADAEDEDLIDREVT